MIDYYLERWSLVPDGEHIATHSSRLLPVLWQGKAAMLKIALEAEEKRGGLLMQWWDGQGAAKVFAADGDAVLLERASGNRSLLSMAENGHDDEASRIICSTASKLHAPRNKPLPDLTPLDRWFGELEPAAQKQGGTLAECAAIARTLLAEPQEITLLHGDIHHGNILDFGSCGWLAIDPKGLYGERGYDYANTFCNPELSVVTAHGRLQRQLKIVAAEARLDPRRQLMWIAAYAGLSAAWFIGDGASPEPSLTVAEIALGALKE